MTSDDTLLPLSPVGKVRRLEASRVADVLARVRERRPKVHLLTSPAALGFSIDLLLALGVGVFTANAPDDLPAFAAAADALLVNLGMLDRTRRDAAETAIEVAKDAGVPWTLDPVDIQLSPSRLAFARRLIEFEPDLVHVNRDEFLGLSGFEAGDETIRDFAVQFVSTLAVTGEVDVVTDGTRTIRVANGHPMMEKVAAIGCAGFAVATAFRAVEPDPVVAGAAALVVMGVVGEVAAAAAHGPGSLAVEMIDALAALDEETVLARAEIR